MPSSAQVTTSIQVNRLQQLGTSRAGPLYLHMVKLEAKVETQAKRNASGLIVRVRTGNLRSNIHSDTVIRGTTLVGQVIADAEYALAVHEGQQPHDIVPVRAKVLAWQGAGGQMRFATRVRHPGTHARPFLSDALRAIT